MNQPSAGTCWQCGIPTPDAYTIEVVAEYGAREIRELPVCTACVGQRVRRRAVVCALVLAALWVLVALNTLRINAIPDLTAVWWFANFIPPVLIAAFISAFFYDGIYAAISQEGRRRAVEGWYFLDRTPPP